MQNALHGNFAPRTKRLARQARWLDPRAGATRERTSDSRPHESALHQRRISLARATARRRHSRNSPIPPRPNQHPLPWANVVPHVGNTRMPPAFSLLGIVRRQPSRPEPRIGELGPRWRVSGTRRRIRVSAHFPAAAKISSSEYFCNSPILSSVMSGFGYCATCVASSA
jgi:hypothetical protein